MFIEFSRFSLILVDFRGPKPFVSVSELPAALLQPHKRRKKNVLDCMSMYFIYFVIFKRSQGPLVFFPKYSRSAQMTMPARRSSEFCVKRRAVLLPMFFLSLICRVTPANIEPSTECQLKLIVDLQPTNDMSWN